MNSKLLKTHPPRGAGVLKLVGVFDEQVANCAENDLEDELHDKRALGNPINDTSCDAILDTALLDTLR